MTPSEIYALLRANGMTHLHHANTVTTCSTYLEQGALLSRELAETSKLPQTDQASDAIDRRYGIWDRVFLDHVDIHHRAGCKKGPNRYGPVLIVLPLEFLLSFPKGTSIEVTRSNPVNWDGTNSHGERVFQDLAELQAKLSAGDFDKMLMISTPDKRLVLPRETININIDDPKRVLSTGEDAFAHAKRILVNATKKSGTRVNVTAHQCKECCLCIKEYSRCGAKYFDSRFAVV